MDRSRVIRGLCLALVCVAVMLGLLLTAAVCLGMADGGVPEETTYEGFNPAFPDGSFNWEDYLDSLDFGSGSRDPDETVDPFDGTLPWDDLEWPTLSPDEETEVEPDWPTLPEGWDTLPEEWDTLPEEWGDVTLPDMDELGDYLAGANGSLGELGGALGAGVASRLTVLEIFAETDDTLYLKTKSFGKYTGSGWADATPYEVLYDGLYSADYLPYLISRYNAIYDTSLLVISPVMQVGVLPYYVTTRHDAVEQLQSSDVTVSAVGGEPYTLYYVRIDNPQVGGGMDGSMASYEDAYAAWVETQYLTVDGETYDYMQRLIAREGFDRNDPAVIEKVAAYVQNAAVYNLAYDQNLDRESNVALAFLGGYKEGVCRHFATAATLLYRSLGIPARYVVGFSADVTANEVTAIKGADAHAWVEVYVEDFGWRYVEVTGAPAASTPPNGGETETVEPDTQPSGIPVTLKPAEMTVKYEGTTVHHNGILEGFSRYEAMGYTYSADVSGALFGCGSVVTEITRITIYDPDGVNVTDEFYVTAKAGVMTAYLYEVTYASDSETRIYDGKPLQTQNVSLSEGILPDGYIVEVRSHGGQTNVGRSYAAFDLIFWYDDGSGMLVDRTHDFLVRKQYGILTVTPATITVKAADAQKVYDGTPLVAEDMEIIEGSLAEGDYIFTFEVQGSQTRIGRSENMVTSISIRRDGANVTGNYNIIIVPGVLRVTSG